MNAMFAYANAFNGTLSGWNVSRVTNMVYMFYGAVYGAKYHFFHMGLLAQAFSMTQIAPTKAIKFKLSNALSAHLTDDNL